MAVDTIYHVADDTAQKFTADGYISEPLAEGVRTGWNQRLRMNRNSG